MPNILKAERNTYMLRIKCAGLLVVSMFGVEIM